MARLSYVLGIWLACGTAYAAPRSPAACLVAFANTVADVKREPLIASTYRELIDRLGGAMTPETMDRMIAAKDPFLVPEETGKDFGGINQGLKGFRELLEKKDWNDEATRAQLLALLGERHKTTVESQAEQEKAVDDSVGDYELDIPGQESYRVSPDGRWVVTLLREAMPEIPNGRTLVLYDTLARKSYRTAVPAKLISTPLFQLDGKHLLFPMKNDRLYSVPFHGGIADFKQGKQAFPATKSGSYTHRLHETPLPGIVFSGVVNGKVVQRDFQNGTVTRLPLPKEMGKVSAGEGEWGTIPGQRRLFVLKKETGDRRRLYLLSYDKKGKFAVEDSSRVFDNYPGSGHVTSDGKYLVFSNGLSHEGLLVGETKPGASFLPVASANGTAAFDGAIAQTIPVPGKHEFLVITRFPPEDGRPGRPGKPEVSRFELVDLATRKTTHSFDLSGVGVVTAEISPDGNTVYYRDLLWQRIKALNLRPRVR